MSRNAKLTVACVAAVRRRRERGNRRPGSWSRKDASTPSCATNYLLHADFSVPFSFERLPLRLNEQHSFVFRLQARRPKGSWKFICLLLHVQWTQRFTNTNGVQGDRLDIRQNWNTWYRSRQKFYWPARNFWIRIKHNRNALTSWLRLTKIVIHLLSSVNSFALQ